MSLQLDGDRRSGIVAEWPSSADANRAGSSFMANPATKTGNAERPYYADSADSAARKCEKVARPTRFELVTSAFGGQRSVYFLKRND